MLAMSDVNNIRTKKVGRRSGSEDTKQAIIEAAQNHFALHGIDGASLRTIADTAEVDPALIVHYFRSKQRLYVESMMPLFDGPAVLNKAIEGKDSEIGIRLATAIISVMSEPNTQKLLLGALRSASSDEAASEMLRKFVENNLVKVICKKMPQPDAELKANLLCAQIVGILVTRYIIKIEPLASVSNQGLAVVLSNLIQELFEQ